jgi:hypothetical protein
MPTALELDVAGDSSLPPEFDTGAIGEHVAIRGAKMETFLHFLAELDALTSLRVNLRKDNRDGAFQEIAHSVMAEIRQRQRDETREGALFEPPFITALRAQIRIMSRAEKDRDQRMSVAFGW